MAIFSELWKVDLGPFGNKLFKCRYSFIHIFEKTLIMELNYYTVEIYVMILNNNLSTTNRIVLPVIQSYDAVISYFDIISINCAFYLDKNLAFL